MRALITLGTLLIAGGCASPQPLPPEVLARFNEPLQCTGAEQCTRYWQLAQAWIAQNSRYRIQTVTDTLITTYGPMNADTSLAYSIVKVPLGGDKYGFNVKAACGNMFGCDLPPAAAIARFKDYVASGSSN